MTLYLLHQFEDPAAMIQLSKTTAGVTDYDAVLETPLQFGVVERLSRTFREESTGLRAEAPKMLRFSLYGLLNLPHTLHSDRVAYSKRLKMKCDTAFGIRRVTRLSKVKILHLWTRFKESENDSIVAEYGLSLEITQSLGESSDTSEGSENNRSFKDSGRSDEEYSEDKASSKKGGSKTPQVRRCTKDSRPQIRKLGLKFSYLKSWVDDTGVFYGFVRYGQEIGFALRPLRHLELQLATHKL
ncbi:hypothetical protein Tco_1102029 [Tanacetum coccineum]